MTNALRCDTFRDLGLDSLRCALAHRIEVP